MEKATPEVDQWQTDAMAEKTVKSLIKNQFDAVYCKTSEDAISHLQSLVEKGTKVGFGGSMTAVELGLVDKLEEKGAEILNKESVTPEPNPFDPVAFKEMTRKLFSSNLYIASANAVTMDGHILNIDGAGNRVATITIGPDKVVLIAGANKITRNIDEAYNRMETVACPKNAKRYNMPNPCAKTGVCMDCKSDTRICRIYHIMKYKPIMTDITVIIVGESLGY
ncbi:MAG: lactate utilization protein [Desulfobacterales bacterium]|nr:lactate utilization protein [Desulfobacterales bacterium]MCP4158780.1 lactate utilization protein [Deltaproteobacteria bacterium]